jgi:ABC-type nitrate/sulfonate/bicarbonate transport system substrate-binding protein
MTIAPSSRPRPLRLGFLALTDAAPLIMARELGCFARHGVAVELCREVGWATIRDKVAFGELDGAQAPAPMLWAGRLGLGCAPVDFCTPFVLNVHGNAITLSARLWQAGLRDAASLRRAALQRRGENKLTFGIVYPHSMHHVLLRQWLRDAGLDGDRDVRIAVVPPAQMYRNLLAGTLDGYCVGEPWNTVAIQQGRGWSPAWSAAQAPGHVEKVLLLRERFLDRQRDPAIRLVAALAESAAWCDEPAHRAELAQVIAGPRYLDLPTAAVEPALLGRFSSRPGQVENVPDFIVFSRGEANAPTPGRAAHLQHELVAAGLVPRSAPPPTLARRLFRDDIYRLAAACAVLHTCQP